MCFHHGSLREHCCDQALRARWQHLPSHGGRVHVWAVRSKCRVTCALADCVLCVLLITPTCVCVYVCMLCVCCTKGRGLLRSQGSLTHFFFPHCAHTHTRSDIECDIRIQLPNVSSKHARLHVAKDGKVTCNLIEPPPDHYRELLICMMALLNSKTPLAPVLEAQTTARTSYPPETHARC